MDTLFKNEELDNNTVNKQEPVTVLGLTFASDEDRRDYFREELRKKLPELKLIEGFPIGEDYDIVNLSDPPYYTACPNPWINNFIAEWEDEKKVLEQEGKRVSNFAVDEPYAIPIKEGKNHPIYNAHSYHTKVPHQVIMNYYLHYTQPGDIVIDNFAGTGMSGVAVNECANPSSEIRSKFDSEWVQKFGFTPKWGERKCILGDLSPITSFITYNYTNSLKKEEFEKAANEIFNQLESELGWTYETIEENGVKGRVNYTIWSENQICPQCHSEFTYWDAAINFEKCIQLDKYNCPECSVIISRRETKTAMSSEFDSVIEEVVEKAVYVPKILNCTIGKTRIERPLNNNDLEILNRISKESLYWVPTEDLIEGGETFRNKKIGISKPYQFYTKRNLLILSRFKQLIGEYGCSTRLKSYLNIWFTSCQSRLHIMNRYAAKHHRHVGPMANTLYVSPTPTEISPFYFIKSKIKDNAFDIKSNHNVVNQIVSATNSGIRDNSIDYIFTDPPFGANIMYSELNFLWESWLKIRTNNREEAISNKTQNKGISEYQGLMLLCFKEYFRVLKPGKWMTVEFSNTSAAVWNAIQISLQRAGFIISAIADLNKGRGGLHGIVGVTAVNQDLAISCYKPSLYFDTKFLITQNSNIGVWDFVEEHLNHLPIHIAKDNATTAIIERNPKILYDRLIAFYVQRSLPVPIDAGNFQKGLKERFLERDGMYFTGVQKVEYDEKRKGTAEFYQASLFVSSEQDGIMWIKDQLKDTPHTYQELQPKWMQAIAGLRKGDILPELRDLLQENFLQDKVGAWYLPDLENEIDLEKIRTNRLLKQFGVYQELASKPKAKIKEIRVEALRAGFKQCYKDKDFLAIVTLAEKIPNNLLMEDEVLLQYYDIANTRVER